MQFAVRCAVFALCCCTDAWVLRSAWTGHAIAPQQFRRGYFESLGGATGLTMDGAIRPDMLPTFLLDAAGALAVPPGMIAIAPLRPGSGYVLARDASLAPYIVIGAEVPIAPATRESPAADGDAALADARMLTIENGQLALVAWDAARPWREDAARLAALRAGCASAGGQSPLDVRARGDRLEVRFGRCRLDAPLPPAAQLAALAGPEWLTILRQPPWTIERWIVWPLLGVIVAKVAAMWWALGAISAVVSSAVIAVAALPLPVPAMLTWPVMLLVALIAAAARVGARVVRRLPPGGRVAAITAMLVAVAALALCNREPAAAPEIRFSHTDDGRPDRCVVLGYSTVKGEGLRGQVGGIRSILNDECEHCRNATAGIFAGGETLAWLRDNYCATPASFGADGQVILLGGANDDYFWGVLSMARFFIVGQQGSEAWRRNEGSAAAASLGQIDAQLAALVALSNCVRAHGAGFLFLHDFLVTDLSAGRAEARAAMLARRRVAVQTHRGSFADLLTTFADDTGVSWFNDYVHLSLVGHRRVAALACAAISPPSASGADGRP